MPRTEAKARKRRGAVMLETALMLPVCLLLLFGIFEYGRFFMMRNVVTNATREGARFAVVHTADKTTADVQDVVMNYLANQHVQFANYSIQVFPVDAGGNPISGASWNDVAIGSGIAVEFTGTYQPVVPKFLMMPNTVQFQIVSIMLSEAN